MITATALSRTVTSAAMPMMPDDRDPVAGFFRLARCFLRDDKRRVHCDLSTWLQSLPATIVTQKSPDAFVNKPVFVEGIINFHNGARFVYVQKIRLVEPVDHVSWLYLAKPEWVKNTDAMTTFIEIYEALSTPYQLLFDEIFADEETLRRFLVAPGSINGHHSYPGGLLDHAVDTARIVGHELSGGRTSCDADTALTAAVLHDLGKTFEYESTKLSNGVDVTSLSTRGILVGHKLTGMDLITQAAARLRDRSTKASTVVPRLTEDQLSALVHAVTASHAPEYVGLRGPITPEANLVAAADRMSSDNHLYASLAPARRRRNRGVVRIGISVASAIVRTSCVKRAAARVSAGKAVVLVRVNVGADQHI